MTRDEHRAQCIEAQAIAAFEWYNESPWISALDEEKTLWIGTMTAAFDILATAGARVVIEEQDGTLSWVHPSTWVLLKEAVDLTNAPETKP